MADRISVARSSVASISNANAVALTADGKKAIIDNESVNYKAQQTPKDSLDRPDLEGGALAAGGAPDLYSRDNIGLLINYASVGLVYGAFPQTIYPFLSYYLNMESYQLNAARTLVSIAWSFKVFIGIITDSFPIMGYKRRPYMVIGWGFCMAILIVMFFLPVPEAYYIYGQAVPKLPLDFKIVQSPEASSSGAIYIILMTLAAIGYVVADVAADGMTVEFAMREPESMRGTTQSMIYFTRTVFSTIAVLIVGFLFNGKDYGGDFNFSIQFNWLMLIIAFGAFWSIPGSILFLKEKKATTEAFTNRVIEMWKIAQRRAVWQVMAFSFLNSLMFDISVSSSYDVQKIWAGVQPINETISTVLGNIVFATAIYLTKRFFLQTNWRFTILWTTLSVVAIDLVVVILTVFDIHRSQWMWLGVPIMELLPYGMRFLICTLVIVEIADEGYEAATYGLLTTVSNLATPFASTITNQIGTHFLATPKHIASDTDEVRWSVFYTFLIMYACKLLSNVTLFLLPKQKKEAQELKRNGGSNKWAGGATLILMAFALVWSVMTNMFSMFESTSCLKIAGGTGC